MRKGIYLSVVFLQIWISLSVIGQVRKADREFRKFNYSIAIGLYNNYLNDHEPTLEIAQKLADAYRLTSNSEKAEVWYSKVLAYPECDPINIYYYAEALKSNGNYMEARNQFLAYGDKVPQEKAKSEKNADDCDQALEWLTNPQQVSVKNIKYINTSYSDFSPAFYGKQLVLTSDRRLPEEEYSEGEIYGWTGNPYLKIYFSQKDSLNNWLPPRQLPGDINKAFHDGAAVFSPDGNTMYFTRTNKVRKAKHKSDKADKKEKVNGFINKLEIYYATKVNGSWTNVQPFAYNDIDEYSAGHPALSPDGNILYFASDMPGGKGETDIYYSEKNPDGTWTKPVNAGDRINTSSKELFPHIAKDGTLYFASEGYTGMGGLDMFSSKGSKSSWSTPVNMKYPVNSPQDDFGIFFDSTSKAGLISSNRNGGIGMDDIYSFKQPECVLSGVTLEKINGQEKILEDVTVKMYRKGDTTEVVAFERSGGKSGTKKVCLRSYEPCTIVYNAEGYFFFNLEQGVTYEIKASKEGYFTKTATVTADCKDADTINLAIILNKIILFKPIVIQDLFFNEEDKLFVRKNIYYDFDRSNIRYDASIELDQLVNLLKDNPDIKIEMGSHTDSRGSDDYNLKLSQRRAESTVRYLASKGIEKDNMTAKGYGEKKPLNGCIDGVKCTDDQYQLNRRTELMVTEIMSPHTHTVAPNETLFSISKKYKISVENLKKLNALPNNSIYVGDKLKVKGD